MLITRLIMVYINICVVQSFQPYHNVSSRSTVKVDSWKYSLLDNFSDVIQIFIGTSGTSCELYMPCIHLEPDEANDDMMKAIHLSNAECNRKSLFIIGEFLYVQYTANFGDRFTDKEV